LTQTLRRAVIGLFLWLLKACGLFVDSGDGTGYIINPMFMQTGTVASAITVPVRGISTTTITFPVAFGNTPLLISSRAGQYSVFETGSRGVSATQGVISYGNIEGTSMTVPANTVRWFAIDPLFVFNKQLFGGGVRYLRGVLAAWGGWYGKDNQIHARPDIASVGVRERTGGHRKCECGNNDGVDNKRQQSIWIDNSLDGSKGWAHRLFGHMPSLYGQLSCAALHQRYSSIYGNRSAGADKDRISRCYGRHIHVYTKRTSRGSICACPSRHSKIYAEVARALAFPPLSAKGVA